MFNLSPWFVSSLLLLVAVNVGADQPDEQLSAEFLQYLAEFSDDEGAVLDPEILAELMHNQQPLAEQQSVQTNTDEKLLVDEVKP